jgi:hypothetical protein
MDSHLDELIAAAAPAVAQRTPELQRDLYSLVAETEAATGTGRPWLGRRIGVAGLAVVGVLGVGTAAAAAGLIDAPSEWLWSDSTLSSGTTCRVAHGANLTSQPADLASASPADHEATLAAARQFVANFDLSAISIDAAITRYQAMVTKERAEIVGQYQAMNQKERVAAAEKGGPLVGQEVTDDDLGPRLMGDDLELAAVRVELHERMKAELSRQGLNAKLVEVDSTNRCSTGSPSVHGRTNQ